MSDLEKYYYNVYPGAKDNTFSFAFMDNLNFYYEFIPKSYIQNQGGIISLESSNYRPPPLNAIWYPIWFKESTSARNWYDPRAWWTYKYKKGFKDNSLVEMMHTVDDNPWYTVYGFWMYYTKGSGVWINIGKSLKAVNKIHSLHLLGMSVEDIAELGKNSEFRLNRYPYGHGNNDTEYITLTAFSRELYPGLEDKTAVVSLITDILDPPDEDLRVRYMKDRVNNSAEWDKTIAQMAKQKGYDSVQFTVQANGNGGWCHEIVYVDVDPLTKVKESEWEGWEGFKDKILIADPNDLSRYKTCEFSDVSRLVCNAQNIS